MTLPLFEFVNKMLIKKAKWKSLDPKTRKLSANLLVCSVYCLIIAMSCVTAVGYGVPNVEIFQLLGLSSVIAWVTLTFLALASNIAGVVVTRAERYHRLNPVVKKCSKGVLVVRMPALCVASYHAGHARARRSTSRSSASKDSSGDGESESGEGDPPAPPLLSSLSLRPHLTFISLFYKQNSFSFPWHFLYSSGCWCLPFDFSPAGKRWGE